MSVGNEKLQSIGGSKTVHVTRHCRIFASDLLLILLLVLLVVLLLLLFSSFFLFFFIRICFRLVLLRRLSPLETLFKYIIFRTILNLL